MSEPIKAPGPRSRGTHWQIVVVLALLAAGLTAILLGGYFGETRHARAFMERELATIAGLKVEQLNGWRLDKLAFAAALQENRANAELAKALAANPKLEPLRTDSLAGLAGLQKSQKFVRAGIVLPGGRAILSYPEGEAQASTPESLHAGHDAWLDGLPRLSGIDLDEKTGRRTLDLMVPLLEGEAPGKPVALFRISFDAAAEIDPLLNDWPNRRESAEAILLRVESGNFVRLSRPRLYDGEALPPPVPVSRFRRPASQAALGEEGIIEGTDYRGRPVVEYLRAVPGTDWLVAVKADLAVMTSGAAGTFVRLAAAAVLLLAACGALLWVFWRRCQSAQGAAERSRWDRANAGMDEFMRRMIEVMPNPAFIQDPDGRCQGANAAFEKLLGRAKSEIIGHGLADDAASPDIAAKHREHDLALLKEPGHHVYEAPLRTWDGEHQVIFIKSTYLRPDGTAGGILGILKDITQRLRAEEELEQLRLFSDSTIQTMTEGMVLTDADGRFTFVNPAAARMLGYTPAEMIDRQTLSFVPPEQHDLVRRADEKRAKGISDRYELDFLHRDGGVRTFLVSGGPRLQGARFAGTMAVLTDITDRKRMEQEIRALSLHDELTGLYNRRGFMAFADHVLKTARRLRKALALIYLDVDDLKRINDTGGHRLGDRALIEIAFILRKSFRETDVIGRLGGDEFAVLAMEMTAMDANTLLQRVQDRLGQFNARSSAEAGFELAASAGVSLCEPGRPMAIEDMLCQADLLMYERKRARKGDPPK